MARSPHRLYIYLRLAQQVEVGKLTVWKHSFLQDTWPLLCYLFLGSGFDCLACQLTGITDGCDLERETAALPCYLRVVPVTPLELIQRDESHSQTSLRCSPGDIGRCGLLHGADPVVPHCANRDLRVVSRK